MPTYPYTSGQAALVGTMEQLRKGAPAKIDAGYLQRFRLASSNESYVISILRFLGFIAEDGTRIDANTKFLYGGDDDFKTGLDAAMRSAYADLFTEMGDEALSADRARLVPWFRHADKTSDLVGNRQASTFQTIAALAGHETAQTVRASPATKGQTKTKTKPKAEPATAAPAAPTFEQFTAPASVGSEAEDTGRSREGGVGLTVRIEVNLPAGGDSETYDAIFASIRKHLMS